jgi:hypothetical protein
MNGSILTFQNSMSYVSSAFNLITTLPSYLVQAIVIETLLGGIISLSLCPNEDLRTLFTSLILNYREFTFAGKFSIVKQLLELKYSNMIRGYKDVFKPIELQLEC